MANCIPAPVTVIHFERLLVNSLSPGRCGRNFKSIIFKLITRDSSLGTRSEITPRWLPQNFTNEKSAMCERCAYFFRCTLFKPEKQETKRPSCWRNVWTTLEVVKITTSIKSENENFVNLRAFTICAHKKTHTLMRKCCHFDEIIITSCIASKMSTSNAASDENFVKMTIFLFQHSRVYIFQCSVGL